jgi:hypothetical protein
MQKNLLFYSPRRLLSSLFLSLSLSQSLVPVDRRNLAQPSRNIRGPIHAQPPELFEQVCFQGPIGDGEGAKWRLEKSGVKKQLAWNPGRRRFSLALERNTASLI